MSWKEIEISEVITAKISGEWGKEVVSLNAVNVLRTANFTNTGEISYHKVVKREIDKKKVDQKRLLDGDIIIEKSGGGPKQPVGRVVYFGQEKEGVFLCNNFTSILRPNKNKIFPRYFFYALFNNYKIGKVLNYQNKTTGIINLKLDRYLSETIPLPDLQTQQQIVAVLDKAQDLIKKREHGLTLLDELQRATFSDMFGDPVLNEKGWKKESLKNIVARLPTGKSIQSVNKESAGDYKVLKTSSVSWAEFKPEESKYLPKGYIAPQEHLVNKFDLLISRMNTTELVGASAFVFNEVKNLALPDRIWKFEWQDLNVINPLFIWFSINRESFRGEISSISTGTSGSMKNISKAKFLTLKVPVPPKKLQDKFAEIALKVQSQISILKTAKIESNNLFQSLLQDAFSGKLNLKDDQVELQSALNKVHWFDEQVKEITGNDAFRKLQQNLDAFNKLKEPFKQFTQLQKQLNKFKIPNLDKITQFQRNLEKLNIPPLKHLKSFDEFNRLKENDLLKQVAGKGDFKIKSFEEFLEEEKKKELEKENDPVLRFIGEKQIGNFTVANYKVNVARAIYEIFGRREFDLNILKETLLDNYAVTVRVSDLKKDLFRLFEEYISSKMRNRFAFDDMRIKMKRDLFNPSFELLQEFIEQGLKKRTIEQVYSIDVRDVPGNEWHPSNVLDTSTPFDRRNRENNNRIYLHLKNQPYED